jgi:hypothetical protein
LKQSPKDTLVGTWVQVSLDTVWSEGTRRPLYGKNALGMIIYTSDASPEAPARLRADACLIQFVIAVTPQGLQDHQRE